MARLIGLAGRAQSGKSTAADRLVEAGFVKLAFAKPVKYLVRQLLLYMGYSATQVDFFEKNKTVAIPEFGKPIRALWQTYGTEWGRELVHLDLWVMLAEKSLLRHRFAAKNKPIVFEDVRFENEAQFIRDNGGAIVHIRRDQVGNDVHLSEQGIQVNPDDIILDNTASLDDFKAQVMGLV